MNPLMHDAFFFFGDTSIYKLVCTCGEKAKQDEFLTSKYKSTDNE